MEQGGPRLLPIIMNKSQWCAMVTVHTGFVQGMKLAIFIMMWMNGNYNTVKKIPRNEQCI